MKLIKIDSGNRVSGSTENFRFTLLSDISFHKAELVYAQIPNTYYNLTADVSIAVNDGLGGSIDLSAGQYTLTELVAAVQAILRSTSGDANYNCTFDDITMLVTINNTTPVAFDVNLADTELGTLLGFSTDTTATSHTGTAVPQMIPQEFYINVSQLGYLGMDNDTRFTFVVPAIGVRGDFTKYEKNADYNQMTFRNGMTLYTFDVSLRKDDGTLYDLHGASWQMIIAVE